MVKGMGVGIIMTGMQCRMQHVDAMIAMQWMCWKEKTDLFFFVVATDRGIVAGAKIGDIRNVARMQIV